MQILKCIFLSLPKGTSTDCQLKGSAGAPGTHHDTLGTSPCLWHHQKGWQGAKPQKGTQQRSQVRPGSGWLWPAGIIRIIPEKLSPSLCVLFLTPFLLSYSPSAYREVSWSAERMERRLEERQSLKDGALLPRKSLAKAVKQTELFSGFLGNHRACSKPEVVPVNTSTRKYWKTGLHTQESYLTSLIVGDGTSKEPENPNFPS